MILLAHLALLAWVPLSLLLFARLPGRLAVLAVYVLGALFLPEIRVLPNVPDAPEPLSMTGLKLAKINVLAYSALLGSLVFDLAAWGRLRPRWVDLPMLAWCLSPFLSATAWSLGENRLDLYDGLAQALDQTVLWGVPWLLGRVYLTSPEAIRDAALALLLGAALYIPFCLIEIRFSPQLHRAIYGFHQHEFLQSMRFGGFRPMVFLEHGLAVGMWMSLAGLTGWWLWRTGAGRSASWLPSWLRSSLVVLAAVVGVALLCKSSGALMLGVVGAVVLATAARLGRPLLLILLLACGPAYMAVRASGAWDGQEAVAWIEAFYDRDRADSLAFRLHNEDLLTQRALERPAFGWGGWGRAQVVDSQGKRLTVADGLWVIALGDRGLFGLTALYATLLLPPALFLWRFPVWQWATPEIAPAAAWAVALSLVAFDYLLNAQINPVYTLAAGGLAGLIPAPVHPMCSPGLNQRRIPSRRKAARSAARSQVIE